MLIHVISDNMYSHQIQNGQLILDWISLKDNKKIEQRRIWKEKKPFKFVEKIWLLQTKTAWTAVGWMRGNTLAYEMKSLSSILRKWNDFCPDSFYFCLKDHRCIGEYSLEQNFIEFPQSKDMMLWTMMGPEMVHQMNIQAIDRKLNGVEFWHFKIWIS